MIKNQKKKLIIWTTVIVILAVVLGLLFFKLNNRGLGSTNKSSDGNAQDSTVSGWFERDGKKYYKSSDGNLLTGYQEIDGADYYFGSDGTMQTGWQNVDGNDYFFDTDGKRVVYGLAKDKNGNIYYCLENGGCLKGKHIIADTVYFFDENGVALSGLVDDENGNTYYVSDEGSAVKGPYKIDDEWYLFDINGLMSSGWLEYEGNKYYTFGDGKMVKNTFAEIENKKYYFDEYGSVVTGWITLENGEQGYALSDGSICLNNVANIDGISYYFDESGRLGNGWVKWNGNTGYATLEGTLTTGRKNLDGKIYDFGEDGIMRIGWIDYSDGKQSYAENDGVLVTDEKKIGNANCKFDSEGYLVSKDIIYDKMVALTFDDGPSKYTPIILDAMEATDSKCTFFVVGNRVNYYPDTVKRAYDLGCEIGSHTYEHVYLTQQTVEGMKSQVEQTNSAVSAITGEKCPVLRPPGGYVDDVVCETIDVPLILWNVDTRDWSTKNTEQTIKGATEGIKDGDIILMHDLYESTADAVYDIIIELQSQGFQCVTVSELAEAKGGAEAGHKYFSFR